MKRSAEYQEWLRVMDQTCQSMRKDLDQKSEEDPSNLASIILPRNLVVLRWEDHVEEVGE